MRGTIVRCLAELVTTRFGVARWKEALVRVGMPSSAVFMTSSLVPDADVVNLLGAVGTVVKLTLAQVLEAFGEYWCLTYAPSVYRSYFDKARTAREFLLNLDDVHVTMTKRAGSCAAPPRFTYAWQDDRHLVVTYASARGLVALMPGLIRGVGLYYHEHLDVSVSGNDVHVKFA